MPCAYELAVSLNGYCLERRKSLLRMKVKPNNTHRGAVPNTACLSVRANVKQTKLRNVGFAKNGLTFKRFQIIDIDRVKQKRNGSGWGF